MSDQTADKGGVHLDAPEVSAGPGKGRGVWAWLFGAYTFLILWGMAYLVLFFTDRLPH